MGWVVYLLECNDTTLYCGITNNLEKRIITHNQGKGAKYTRARVPVRLVYQQSVETKSEALKLEYKIKKMTKKEKLNLIR
jgi:putative endonuclease